jgi:ABC-type polysaccharide/polyol phosphate transport system ATPase subunit
VSLGPSDVPPTPVAVSVRHLSKGFKLYRSPWHRVAEWITLGRVIRHETFWALRGIDLDVRRGECLGIIGANGAGKTTLLKILARALYPTTGEIAVTGRLVSLLELGTGFHPDLTGRQNVFQSARLLGFPEEDVRRRLPEIIDFAELGAFIDRPVKQYSSGMFVRLAFSLFAHLEPDVYIVDEALSVGDIFFQQKCFGVFRELRRRGSTILLVSHDMDAVTHLCDRTILLSRGEIVSEGDPQSVAHDYFALAGQSTDRPRDPRLRDHGASGPGGILEIPEAVRGELDRGIPGTHSEVGTRAVEVVGFAVTDEHGAPAWSVTTGRALTFWQLVEARQPCADLNIGIHFYDRRGILVFAANTAGRGITLRPLGTGERLLCTLSVTMSVQPGEYTVLPEIGGWRGAGDVPVSYDRLDSMPAIVVTEAPAGRRARVQGLVELEADVAWMRLDRIL